MNMSWLAGLPRKMDQYSALVQTVNGGYCYFTWKQLPVFLLFWSSRSDIIVSSFALTMKETVKTISCINHISFSVLLESWSWLYSIASNLYANAAIYQNRMKHTVPLERKGRFWTSQKLIWNGSDIMIFSLHQGLSFPAPGPFMCPSAICMRGQWLASHISEVSGKIG